MMAAIEQFENQYRSRCEEQGKLAKGIWADEAAKLRLKQECERVRIQLSFIDKQLLCVPKLHAGLDFKWSITRKDFEALCQDEFGGLRPVINKALTESKLTAEQISHVIMVGGMSRTPFVSCCTFLSFE